LCEGEALCGSRHVHQGQPHKALTDHHALPAAGAYQHWGTYQPGAAKEPNRLTGAEECAVANFSQAYGGAWGWADTPCSGLHASLCRLEGGHHLRVLRTCLLELPASGPPPVPPACLPPCLPPCQAPHLRTGAPRPQA
jgi:hypothetical protein